MIRASRRAMSESSQNSESLSFQSLESLVKIDLDSDGAHRCAQAERLLQELSMRRKAFEKERITWVQEKEKVLRYQRQLQLNYVQMFRRTRALESEVETLTLELELLNAKSGIKLKNGICGELGHTVEL